MREDVKACVEARTGFFGTYMTVPPALQPELDAFLARITALGEESGDAAEFEQTFQATGLSDVFNGLVSRCTPQAYQMTEEDKAHSRQVAKEIFQEDKERILKEAGAELLDSAQMLAEDKLRQERVRQMRDAGVMDEYTKVTNAVEDAGIVAGFFKGLFGKKKK